MIEIALMLMTLGLAIGVLLLTQAYNRLLRQHQELATAVSRQGDDLLGLCAAAVQVDRRVLEREQALRQFQERLDELTVREEQQHGYYPAIQKVKRGAHAEDLVSEFGLSLSEATLLTQLYSPQLGGFRG